MEILFDGVKISTEESGKVEKYIRDNCPSIIYYDDFIFDIPSKVFFKVDGTPYTEGAFKNEEWQSILDDILKASYDNDGMTCQKHLVDLLEKAPNDDGNVHTVESRIGKMQYTLDEKISEKWKEVLGNFAFESFVLNFQPRADNVYDFSFSVKGDKEGTQYDISERSKGCRWFFSFLIFTEFRQWRDNKNTLFLLDEPASNLNSTSQEKVLESLKGLCKKSSVVYTTHSLHLIDLLTVKEGIISLQNLSEQETEPPKIKSERLQDFSEKSQAHIRPLLDCIQYTSPRVLGDLKGENENEFFVKLKVILKSTKKMGRKLGEKAYEEALSFVLSRLIE